MPREPHGAGPEAQEEEPFLGMLENQKGEFFEGSFWEAIETELLPVPPLLRWNDWLAWRKTMRITGGWGLPSGPRGADIQQREAELFRAAMERYHPTMRREDPPAPRGDHLAPRREEEGDGATRPKLSRAEAREEVKSLFPPSTTPPPSTAGTTANIEYLLKRAGTLLPRAADFEDHSKRLTKKRHSVVRRHPTLRH